MVQLEKDAISLANAGSQIITCLHTSQFSYKLISFAPNGSSSEVIWNSHHLDLFALHTTCCILMIHAGIEEDGSWPVWLVLGGA